MAPDFRYHYHTMTNPNTNALMYMLQNDVRADNGPTAAGLKTAYVGKDRFPIMILKMDTINDDAWKKSTSFESLALSVRGGNGRTWFL